MPSQPAKSDECGAIALERDHKPETLHGRLEDALQRRRARGLLRDVRAPQEDAADFSSNDYLGLSTHPIFQKLVARFARGLNVGATGSRLLSGHSAAIAAVEKTAAIFHDAECALLFNSGYAANVSLLSCVPSKDDAVVYDELVHASVHDGMRASRTGTRIPFAHNDMSAMTEAVCKALRTVSGNVLVVVETVYSMDGDVVPIEALLVSLETIRAREKRDVLLVADEAHAGGLFGQHGAGVCAPHARHTALLARVVTFGKAFGGHGAVVLCSPVLRKFLLNYARPLVYSTALPPHSVAAIRAAYEFAQAKEAAVLRKRVWMLRDRFHERAHIVLPLGCLLPSQSPIQGVLVSGNRRCVLAAEYVRSMGFEVYPIRAPTVPAGSERLRIVLHAHNSAEQVDGLVEAVREALGKGEHVAAL